MLESWSKPKLLNYAYTQINFNHTTVTHTHTHHSCFLHKESDEDHYEQKEDLT